MCLSTPYMRTDEQFFYKEVRRNANSEMIAPLAETILHERIGKWQSIGFLRSFLHVEKIWRNVDFRWRLLGKLFVNRYWQDPGYNEVWLVESSSKKELCDNSRAALGKFRFLGQVIDREWTPEEKARETNRKKRSEASKKGWKTRRKNA